MMTITTEQEEVVSDNGPRFTSVEFADFMMLNGIRHMLSAPYHSATNGTVQRMVQVLKKGLKAAIKRLSREHQLSNLPLTYISAPHTTTAVSPARLFCTGSGAPVFLW